VTATYEVDELTPAAVIFATTTEQVSEILQAANKFQKSVVPWGSGSKQQVGPCLSTADTILCLKNMDQIIDLNVNNFTVQVGASMVNGKLQEQLAEDKLFFPLDPFYMATSTIGGEIAANVSGPLRFMYGTARDIVLGLTVVTPTGDILHTGGQTMKNVAGTDLCKMFIGSWGTLGIITEAVLRLFPLPEVRKCLWLTFPSSENAFALVAQLLNSSLTPSSIDLIDRVAGRSLRDTHGSSLGEGEVILMINIEGGSEEVERHQKDIKTLAEANKARNITTLDGQAATQAWHDYRELHRSIPGATPSTIQGKASVPISQLGDMFQAVKQIGNKYSIETGIVAHGGNGILYPYFAASDDDISPIIDSLRQSASGMGGFFMVERAPLPIRKKTDALPRRSDYTLMKQLKTKFDPNNILNPGRAVGGLY